MTNQKQKQLTPLSECLSGLDLKNSITNHHELRQDVSIDCSSPSLTDQSMKNACDINVIMANYAKTGMLPCVNGREARFIDNTSIPSLEDAFKIVKQAQQAFNELPPDIRKLMDNEPSNLESFISNPENADILLKHGLILKREIQDSSKNTDVNTQVPQTKDSTLAT